MHQIDPGFLADDRNGGEGGTAKAATGTDGGGKGAGGRVRDNGDFLRAFSMRSLRFPFSLSFSTFYTALTFFLSISLYFSLSGQARRGRGSYHGPPADCERSRRTVNREELCIISS